ncbi:hypothetical protein J2T12_004826 [Paenibacillus anaericanus]|nr:hypothetical protein [Paenibacillus anaericanus]
MISSRSALRQRNPIRGFIVLMTVMAVSYVC